MERYRRKAVLGYGRSPVDGASHYVRQGIKRVMHDACLAHWIRKRAVEFVQVPYGPPVGEGVGCTAVVAYRLQVQKAMAPKPPKKPAPKPRRRVNVKRTPPAAPYAIVPLAALIAACHTHNTITSKRTYLTTAASVAVVLITAASPIEEDLQETETELPATHPQVADDAASTDTGPDPSTPGSRVDCTQSEAALDAEEEAPRLSLDHTLEKAAKVELHVTLPEEASTDTGPDPSTPSSNAETEPDIDPASPGKGVATQEMSTDTGPDPSTQDEEAVATSEEAPVSPRTDSTQGTTDFQEARSPSPARAEEESETATTGPDRSTPSPTTVSEGSATHLNGSTPSLRATSPAPLTSVEECSADEAKSTLEPSTPASVQMPTSSLDARDTAVDAGDDASVGGHIGDVESEVLVCMSGVVASRVCLQEQWMLASTGAALCVGVVEMVAALGREDVETKATCCAVAAACAAVSIPQARISEMSSLLFSVNSLGCPSSLQDLSRKNDSEISGHATDLTSLSAPSISQDTSSECVTFRRRVTESGSALVVETYIPPTSGEHTAEVHGNKLRLDGCLELSLPCPVGSPVSVTYDIQTSRLSVELETVRPTVTGSMGIDLASETTTEEEEEEDECSG